jgi:hypothetical protein
MRKVILICVMIVLVLVACSSKATPEIAVGEPTTAKDNWITYKVVQKTGLYESVEPEDISEDAIRVLTSGELLKPANNAYDLSCKDVTMDTIKMNFCSVEVIKTGETGWVLRKWIDRN